MSPQHRGQQGGQQYTQQQGQMHGGFPGKRGRGADQGAADERHSQEFRREMHEIAEQRPRGPQTGQFLPEGSQGGQQQYSQQRGGQQGRQR